MNGLVNAVLAVAVHEIAHLGMAGILGVQVYQVGVSWKGPFLRRAPGTDRQNVAITLAGPGANLLLAFLCVRISHGFALVNLVLGVCNLLPLPASDGQRALRLLETLWQIRSDGLFSAGARKGAAAAPEKSTGGRGASSFWKAFRPIGWISNKRTRSAHSR